MSGGFGSIIERKQFGVRSRGVAQSRRDQPISQHGILGKECAVEIAADCVSVTGAFETVSTIVTAPNSDFPDRLGSWSQARQSAVVFETDQLSPLTLDHDIPDESLIGSHRNYIEYTDSREWSRVERPVFVTEKLIPTANGQSGRSGFDVGPDPIPFSPCRSCETAICS